MLAILFIFAQIGIFEASRRASARVLRAEGLSIVALAPLDLDSLTVADDKTFLDRLSGHLNLPDYVRNDLPDMY